MYERRQVLVYGLCVSILYRLTSPPALLPHVHGEWYPAGLTWQRQAGGTNGSDLAEGVPRDKPFCVHLYFSSCQQQADPTTSWKREVKSLQRNESLH